MRFDKLARASGSRPDAGSSRMRILGWLMIVWAMASRWRRPRERSLAFLSLYGVRSSDSSAQLILCSISSCGMSCDHAA